MSSGLSRLIAAAAKRLRRWAAPRFETTRYWQERYATGGTSGDGSYGRLARFKADTVNDFLRKRKVLSAIEYGCGDGHQLALIEYPSYVGLDVSPSAVSRCADRFVDDPTKSFFVYDPEAYHDALGVFRAEAALSLDVIYHIVSDVTFNRYMTHLCSAASRFVIVYSTDFEEIETPHVRHRQFTGWIRRQRPEWHLAARVPNPYEGTGPQESNAAFYFFERTG